MCSGLTKYTKMFVFFHCPTIDHSKCNKSEEEKKAFKLIYYSFIVLYHICDFHETFSSSWQETEV